MKKSAPAVALAGVVLAAAAACSTGGSDADTGAGSGGGSAPEMEHIHGIGVDPQDGAVYAGTHYGLFRIADGSATRVADRVQDFMGFTVAGPEHFLASGHPGEGQGGPGSLGLIESTDAGQTWHDLSLSGEADFHSLEYRHDRVYGLNSMTGRLLVSTDMRAWQELSSEAMADFAVSPTDPEVLVATTEQGLARSGDGGSTFEPVGSAPLMIFVGWAEDGTLAGVTPDGVVYTAANPAGAWTERASLGAQPEALTIVSANEIYAAASGAVLVSTDGGRTFSPRSNSDHARTATRARRSRCPHRDTVAWRLLGTRGHGPFLHGIPRRARGPVLPRQGGRRGWLRAAHHNSDIRRRFDRGHPALPDGTTRGGRRPARWSPDRGDPVGQLVLDLPQGDGGPRGGSPVQ